MIELPLTAADERAHPPDDQPRWGESWYFDFTDRAGTLGGYVRLGLFPNLGVAWYWACLVGAGRPLVTVIDHDVPLPRSRSLEIRTEGLWATHTVETPGDHVSLGCEAFAVAVDDPAETYRGLRGDRVPFGLDLEWETDGDGIDRWAGAGGYDVSCHVHGDILVGDEAIAFDGIGQRDHSWGVVDWWRFGWVRAAGWLDDGTRFRVVTVRGAGAIDLAGGYVMRPGEAVQQIERGEAVEERDEQGFPTTAHLVCGDLALAVEPVALAPVNVVDPVDQDGSGPRVSRVPRALCRFESPDGRRGVGWTEWNQPSR